MAHWTCAPGHHGYRSHHGDRPPVVTGLERGRYKIPRGWPGHIPPEGFRTVRTLKRRPRWWGTSAAVSCCPLTTPRLSSPGSHGQSFRPAGQCSVSIRDENGVVLATPFVLLPAFGQTAFALPDRFSAAANRRGVIEVPCAKRASRPRSRFNPSGGSLPAILVQ